MITNTGKNIIGKYMLGIAPAYASYIAVGCGTKPLSPYVTGQPLPDYSTKETLDFEMFRVPISSRGFVDENGVTKIVLTGELPSEERYEISEVGIYSAGFNSYAGSTDSKTIYSFTTTENWKKNGSTAIDVITEQLDSTNNIGVIRDTYTIDGVVKSNVNILQTNADNKVFTSDHRLARNERSRFFNNMVMMRSNSSTITETAGVPSATGNFIQLSGTSLDLSKNSPIDEIKLAFSVVDKDGSNSNSVVGAALRVKILFEVTASTVPNAYARFETIINHNNTSGNTYNFNQNRYFVSTKQIQELVTTDGFPWKVADTVKIYAQVLEGANVGALATTDKYYVCLDAMRVENKSSINPLYGLVGYNVVRSTGALPIVKSSNTTNYIEFRFGLDTV
jgi:hypothetical protein